MFESNIEARDVRQLPRTLVASVAIHSLAILLLFAVRFSGAVPNLQLREHATIIAPATVKPISVTRIRTPKIRAFRPAPVEHARLEIPAILIASAPVIDTPNVVMPEITHTALSASIPAIKAVEFSAVKPVAPQPAPRPVIKAAGFQSTETSAAGPARGKLSATGAFDSTSNLGGAPAKSGPVMRSSGFLDASPSSTGNGAARGVIKNALFGDTSVDKDGGVRKQAIAAASTPVEIISKPRPAYTDAARAQKLEGEVLLEMQFCASGEARLVRVVRGLGHGLDENAVAAASSIRFRPALRDGAAVDSTAVVHIVFQLAN